MNKPIIKLFLILSVICLLPNPSNSQIKIGVIGSESAFITNFTRYVAERNENMKIVAFCPAFSNENSDSADVKISQKTKKLFEEREIDYVKTTYELLRKVDFVVMETNEGMLDFASAFQVIKARKGLVIQQPRNFELSDIILLFALSKKYEAPMNFFSQDQTINLISSFSTTKPMMVSTSVSANQSIASIFSGTDTIYVLKNPLTEKSSLFLSDSNGIEPSRVADLQYENIFEGILSFSRDIFPNGSENMRKILVPEGSGLDIATLIFSLQKSKSQNGENVYLKDEYQKAFDTAFKKMMHLYN